MICPYCQEAIADGAVFCPLCGKMLNTEPASADELDAVISAGAESSATAADSIADAPAQSAFAGGYTPPPSPATTGYVPPVVPFAPAQPQQPMATANSGYTPPPMAAQAPAPTPAAPAPYGGGPAYAPYTVPYAPPAPKPEKPGNKGLNWAAILGLVFGALGLLSCCVSFGGLSLAGLVFSIVGLKSKLKGVAIAGLVISIVGLLIGLIWLAMIFLAGETPASFFQEIANASASSYTDILNDFM